MPQDFLPAEDTGRINAYTDGANGISFAEMVRHQNEAAQILAADPNVEGFMSSVGSGGTRGGLNSGTFRIQLKTAISARLSVDQVITELRQKFQKIPGMNVVMQNRPPITHWRLCSSALYQYTMQDIDLNELYSWSQKLHDALQQDPIFADVNTDLDLSTPSVECGDRPRPGGGARHYAQQIETALGAAFGGQQIAPIYTQADQYWVDARTAAEISAGCGCAEPALSRDIARGLCSTTNTGSLVPLSAVAKLTRGTQPLASIISASFPP